MTVLDGRVDHLQGRIEFDSRLLKIALMVLHDLISIITEVQEVAL